MSLDAPDWERVVTTVAATGDVPDAPDWERIVVGSGGTPIGGPTAGVNAWTPYAAAGFAGVTLDPTVINDSASHATGVMALVMFTALLTTTVNNVTILVQTGATCTANQNFVVIYDTGQTTAGTATKLAQSAAGACDIPFRTSGISKVPLSTGASLTLGQNYFLGFVNNGGTPSFYDTNVANASILNPVGTTYPIRCFGAGPFTSPPSTLAFSSLTITTHTWLFFIGP
jgi:hypothetical protein